MKNLFYLILLSLAPIVLNAQNPGLYVVSPGNVGVGTDTPTERLEVEGNVKVNGTKFAVGANATGVITVEIGEGRATDGSASIDIISDKSANPNYGMRINRDALGTSRFAHRGPRPLLFLAQDIGADMKFLTQNTTRMILKSNGYVGVGTQSPTAKFHVNGAAVKPGGGDWGAASDRRLKKNIKNFDLGLEAVLSINPVTYQYNGKAGITNTEEEYVGIIAQDFEKIAPYAIGEYTYSEVREDVNAEIYTEDIGETETYLSVDATSIRYMLVNAVKEQQNIIQNQQNMIDKQQGMIESLQKTVLEIKEDKVRDVNHKWNNNEAVLGNQAMLKQNAPNPFSKTTTIAYYLPETTKTASIKVLDLNGRTLKSINLQGTGEASIELSLNEFHKGMYLYTLIVDGNIVDSKQMILE